MVQKLMKSIFLLFLMSTSLGVSSESWTRKLDAVAELVYKIKLHYQVGSLG
jgi:hypothetical protein